MLQGFILKRFLRKIVPKLPNLSNLPIRDSRRFTKNHFAALFIVRTNSAGFSWCDFLIRLVNASAMHHHILTIGEVEPERHRLSVFFSGRKLILAHYFQ